MATRSAPTAVASGSIPGCVQLVVIRASHGTVLDVSCFSLTFLRDHAILTKNMPSRQSSRRL